jgi:hypothetical protein
VAVAAYRQCLLLGPPAYLERSKSAKGWHLWVFFTPAVPAAKARALGFALAPPDALLTDGGFAEPESAAGIEVFPKCDRIKPDGFGNAVWLPWNFEAKRGGNEFYRRGPSGLLVPFIPLEFDTADGAALDRALLKVAEGPDGE